MSDATATLPLRKPSISGVNTRAIAYAGLLPLFAAAIAGSVYLIGESLVARALRDDAASTAQTWGEHFSGGVQGLDEVMRTGRITAAQRDFIVANAKLGKVFRFRLFDTRGRLVLASDKIDEPPVSVSLRDHDAGAVQAIQNQRIVIDVIEQSDGSGAPAIHAEAHVPLLASDGESLGLAELHIDQSQMASLLRQAIYTVATCLAAILAALLLAFTIVHGRWSRAAEDRFDTEQHEDSPKPLAQLQSAPVPLVFPAAKAKPEVFDDWLVRIAEDAVQCIPGHINLECHLGLGDAVLPFDGSKLSGIITGLIEDAAAALSLQSRDARDPDDIPCITVSTSLSRRGAELSVADNRLHSENVESARSKDIGQFMELHGGGLDLSVEQKPGVRITAWWPLRDRQAEAA